MYYNNCTQCGGTLDPGERCDCSRTVMAMEMHMAPFEEVQFGQQVGLKLWSHVPAGKTVKNGFGIATAPERPGAYTLYEIIDAYRAHKGHRWYIE